MPLSEKAMDDLAPCSSFSSSPSKSAAVEIIAGLRRYSSLSDTKKVPFKALFTAVLVHLGRVLFQIVVAISGFFPTLVIASHIGGFILERSFEIVSAENGYTRFRKVVFSFLEILVLLSYCYFLFSYVYMPVFFVFVDFFSTV